MFLLIPARISPVITTGSVFTFQYVSINTFVLRLCSVLYISLHSNMFLLIPTGIIRSRSAFPSLHSNMFLLIPDDVQKFLKRLRTLHSNMFLLIRSGAQTGSGATASFTFQYVSINTKSHQS